jgi:CBS domain containing-hemolysin-like protein
MSNSSDLAVEIRDLMDEGQAKGLITHEESHMVSGVLYLKQTRAQSIMIPRTEVTTASVKSTLREIIALVNTCGHTRIPIHRENLDDIAGILHAKDLLKLWGQEPDADLPLNILRKPYFVPESQTVSELLKELKDEKTHLAIVTDEYGGTAGIITIEDIIEEIVGEIMDEHDNEPPLLIASDANTALVDARLELKKLEEHFGVQLPTGDFESVGGLIIHLLGRLPQVDEKVVLGDLEFKIRRADQRKIHKILITRMVDPPPAQAAESPDNL